MKKMRAHIYVLLGVFLVLFVVGSLADYQISSTLFSRGNAFGLAVSTVGTIPGYGLLALLGGGFFALFLKKLYKTPINVLFLLGAIGLYASGTFFAGREFFGPNGFENSKIYWLGFIISAVVMFGCSFLGYYLISKSQRKNMWLLLGIIAVAAFFALVPGVTLLKAIFHRPRFRSIDLYESAGLEFHNWWQRCSNYKDLMAQFNLTSEEFKSFPSGHSGAAMVFLMGATFLPLVDAKYEKITLPVFYGGLAWAVLVMFSRILVGAHFLSDVSMGAIISLVCLLIANEVVIHLKAFNEEQKVEEPQE